MRLEPSDRKLSVAATVAAAPMEADGRETGRERGVPPLVP